MPVQNSHINLPLSSFFSSSPQTLHELPSNSNNTTVVDIYNNNNSEDITQQILGDGNVNFDEDKELEDKRNNHPINPPVPLPLPPPLSSSLSRHQHPSHMNFVQLLPPLANKSTDDHQPNRIHKKRQVERLGHMFA